MLPEMLLEIAKDTLPDTVKYKLKVISNETQYSVLDLPQAIANPLERFLVKRGVFTKRCGSCKNFNLQKGQSIFASNPTFRRVAMALSPAQMVTVKRARDEQTEVERAVEDPTQVAVDKTFEKDRSVFNPPQATWEWQELGYCYKFSCGEFSFKSFVLDKNGNPSACPEWR